MTALKHSEIIKDRGHLKHVNVIVERFIETQSNNGIYITDEHKRELNKVAKILVAKHKTSKPVIIHSGLGFGKSTLLLEYIKYMCSIDEEFGALIVKKTIKECKDFVIGLGLKKECVQEVAFGNYENNPESLYRYHEEKFIALALRGFNYDDCSKNLVNPNEDSSSKEKLIENYGDRVQEYSHSICKDCNELCSIKNAKHSLHKHRIVVATHRRLFLSNDNKDLLNNLTQWEDMHGNKHKRLFVFVDEKLDAVDMGQFKLKEWNNMYTTIVTSAICKEIKEDLYQVNHYLVTLPYPNDTNTITKRKPYNRYFEFHKSIYGLFAENLKLLECLNNVEKALRNEGTVSRDWRDSLEIISYYNYLKVDEYFRDEFSKCVILDATAKLDNDYNKSDVIYVNDLNIVNIGKINVYKTKGISASKTKLYYDGNKGNAKNDNLEYYKRNVEYIAKDIQEVINETRVETLIVCYKDITDKIGNVYPFKQDLKTRFNSLDIASRYHVVHFGQYTTGVNDFKDCKNIIIIGLLNKGTLYYNNKAFCLSINPEEIKMNEFTIEMIQQIGRTSIRSGDITNVYMIGDNRNLFENIKAYFDVNINDWITRYYNAFNIDANRNKPRYHATEYILNKLVNYGDTINKKDIKEYLVNSYGVGIDTAAKVVQDKLLINYLLLKGIVKNPNNNRQFIKMQ